MLLCGTTTAQKKLIKRFGLQVRDRGDYISYRVTTEEEKQQPGPLVSTSDMADKISKERRSENMRRIRSKDMKPEMTVRYSCTGWDTATVFIAKTFQGNRTSSFHHDVKSYSSMVVSGISTMIQPASTADLPNPTPAIGTRSYSVMSNETKTHKCGWRQTDGSP